jgi:NADPH-dependent glutamate synthase beta chain and related oxidoreductases
MGVEFRLSAKVGKDVTVGELMETFDAVFLGMGTYTNMAGGYPGDSSPTCIRSSSLFDCQCQSMPRI